MPIVFPEEWFTTDQIKDKIGHVEDTLRKVASDRTGTGTDDWHVREFIPGVDLLYLTAVVAGQTFWGFDAASLVAVTLSSIWAAGAVVPNNTWFGFTGMWSVENDWDAASFVSGSNTVELWQLDHIVKPNMELIRGFCRDDDDFVLFAENRPIIMNVRFRTAVDKIAGFIAYTCERIGITIS